MALPPPYSPKGHPDVGAQLYTDLDDATFETRFVELEIDADTTYSTPLRGHLFARPLFKPPSCIALSYCWGDMLKRPCSITLAGAREVAITQNLDAALRQLRSRHVTVLWIDALCIDQGNIVEKSRQVARMGQIFSLADKVVCWIADVESSDDCAAALRFLRHKPPEPVKTRPPSSIGFLDVLADWTNLQDRATLPREIYESLSDELSKIVGPLRSILLNVYFTRAWIFQETAKAAAAELWVGQETIDLADLLAWVPFLRSRTVVSPDVLARLEAHRSFQTMERASRSGAPRMLLLEALLLSSQAAATNPRDKVFALLGLSRDGSEMVPVPNYAEATQSIFQNVVQKMVCVEGLVAALLLAVRREPLVSHQGDHAGTRAPSWVPDIATSRWQPPWVSDTISFSLDNPTKGSSPRTPGTLNLQGIRLETVKNTISSSPNDADTAKFESDPSNPDIREVFTSLEGSLWRVYGLFDKDRRTLSPLYAAVMGHYRTHLFCCLLIKIRKACSGSRPDPPELSNQKTRELFEKNSHTLKAWYRSTMALCWKGTSLATWLTRYEESHCDAQGYLKGRMGQTYGSFFGHRQRNVAPHVFQPVQSIWIVAMMGVFNRYLTIVISSRDIFRTLHHDARPGDVVFRIRGCALPLLLRPTNEKAGAASAAGLEQYTLIGEGCHFVRKQESDWAAVPGFKNKDFQGLGQLGDVGESQQPNATATGWQDVVLV